MSGAGTNDPTTEFAKELARQIPAKELYGDAVSPAAKQTGQILSDIVKVIQLALAPFQLLAAYQDRLRRFIDKAVRRVPEERQISPAPQILGPIIEGIRYEPEGTPIDEMFSELLSRSMDSQRVDEAHPAYPIIIKQLSADEAKVLAKLNNNEYDFTWTMPYDRSTNLFQPRERRVERDTFPRDGLTFPDNVSFYFDHLWQLGLAGIFQEGNQQPLYDAAHTRQVGVRSFDKFRLTELGKRFVQACMTKTTDVQN
jgi:hypothetical protein